MFLILFFIYVFFFSFKGLKEPIALEAWDQAAVAKFVTAFLKERFPTILVLNKIDSPDADKNIAKICAKYSPDDIVLSSALAECFLRKLRGQVCGEKRQGKGNVRRRVFCFVSYSFFFFFASKGFFGLSGR